MTAFTVISLGWGVQSFTLAAMSALGELPPVDVAIHADTTHERADTYAFAATGYAPSMMIYQSPDGHLEVKIGIDSAGEGTIYTPEETK